MGRIWPLNGPEEDRLTFDEVAKMFGYEPGSLRRLVGEGRFPPPRGIGLGQYYTGEDVAIVWLMFGRWQPAAPAPKGAGKKGEEEAAG